MVSNKPSLPKTRKQLKCVTSNFKNRLYNDIVRECNSFFKSTVQNFSLSVRKRLESCQMEVRTEIVSRITLYGAPLFIAGVKSNLAMARYLIDHCKADVEQLGPLLNADVRHACDVTPLQSAAIVRDLPMVKLLLSREANIDALSSVGETALQLACLENNRTNIIAYLLENGAKVNNKFHNGNTCLMECVNHTKKCALLIKHDVDVNATNRRGETALQLSVKISNLNTTILLLNHKADPYAQNDIKDDALRIACMYPCTRIVKYLMRTVYYSPEKRVETWELLGSAFVNTNRLNNYTFKYWRVAMSIRKNEKLQGKSLPEKNKPRSIFFQDETEFSTIKELKRFQNDRNKRRNQSLIILERILGFCHYHTLEKLSAEAKRLLLDQRHQDCINFWNKIMYLLGLYFFLVRAEYFFFIHSFTNFIQDIRQMLLRMGIPMFVDLEFLFRSVAILFLKSSLISNLTANNSPLFTIDSLAMHYLLECMMRLLHMLFETTNTQSEGATLHYCIRIMIDLDLRSPISKNSVLHYFVNPEFFHTLDASHASILSMVELLLNCGYNVNARNVQKMTPLHVTSTATNEIIEPMATLLLNHGACLLAPSDIHLTPADLIKQLPTGDTIPLMNYISLKMLAAQVIVKYRLEYTNLPATFRNLIDVLK